MGRRQVQRKNNNARFHRPASASGSRCAYAGNGSIAPGKTANFTVLEQDPYEVDPIKIKDIPIWGTLFEGRIFPIENAAAPQKLTTGISLAMFDTDAALEVHDHTHGGCCACAMSNILAKALKNMKTS